MIKAIIGLGNPGKQYQYQRHNIGFRIIDLLAQNHGASWQQKELMEIATIQHDNHAIILIKPQTFMNSSGAVIPYLIKKGIKPEEILVIHDELELLFGQIKTKQGGSHKGHNGLRSIIAACGDQFMRLRFGISRPADRNDVPTYVLQNFSLQESDQLPSLIENALAAVESLINQ